MYCDLWQQYIQVRKLFKRGNYSRAETICGNTVVGNNLVECWGVINGKAGKSVALSKFSDTY